MRLSRALVTVLFAPVVLSGCNVDQLVALMSPTAVVVQPDSVSLAKNAQATVLAVAYNALGSPLPGYLAVWSSADTTIARVSAQVRSRPSRQARRR